MTIQLILASGSEIRAQMLRNAAVEFQVERPRVDEETIKAALISEGARPRDIADTLAEFKARKISEKFPGDFALGCDQVLDFEGTLLSKPASVDEAHAQLTQLSGKRHMLLSAAVLCQDGQPIWRHVGQVRLQMRMLPPDYLDGYVSRNWNSIRNSVGAYKLEEEGVRLFTAIDGGSRRVGTD
ncbi:MAG: Maf family protein [Pseudomonadota bacterium]